VFYQIESFEILHFSAVFVRCVELVLIMKMFILYSPDGSPWQPTKYLFVCSRHFIGNAKSDHPHSPSFVPTIFPDKYGGKPPSEDAQLNARKRQDSFKFTNTNLNKLIRIWEKVSPYLRNNF
jgi:hypothetical protein